MLGTQEPGCSRERTLSLCVLISKVETVIGRPWIIRFIRGGDDNDHIINTQFKPALNLCAQQISFDCRSPPRSSHLVSSSLSVRSSV